MKKLLLFCSFLYFMLPAQVFAQYSNASLNGPWIVFSDNYVYITFDGSGNITALGTSDDSLHPVGSYVVSSLGVVSATVNMIQGSMTLNGQMLNDSTVNFVDTVPKGVSRMIAVTNPAALAGTWNGIIYDSSSQAVLNFQITVNNSGNVTAANGISLVAGKIFEARDSFAAYITTTDANCRYQALQLEGLYLGDSLTGKADLGQHHDTTGNCNSRGHVSLTRTASSVTTVKNDFEFSTYPNPFSDRLEITLKTAAGKTQIDLYDVLGRKAYSGIWNGAQNISITNLGELNSGVYFLTFTTNGKVITKRIIKN